jgi:hypothetical protein
MGSLSNRPMGVPPSVEPDVSSKVIPRWSP